MALIGHRTLLRPFRCSYREFFFFAIFEDILLAQSIMPVNILETSLEKLPKGNIELQLALAEEIWTLPHRLSKQNAAFYMDRYISLSNNLDFDNIKPSSHREALDIVNIVRKDPTQTKQILVQHLLQQDAQPKWLIETTNQAINEAFEYAISLWLMINPKGWLDHQTIGDFVEAKFPRTRLEKSNTKLTFDATTLRRIARIEILWTSNLDEHLEFNKQASVVSVFCHASLLGRDSNGNVR